MKALITSNIDTNIQLEDRNGKLILVHYSDTNIKETKSIELTKEEASEIDASNIHLHAMGWFSRNQHNGEKPRRVKYHVAGNF